MKVRLRFTKLGKIRFTSHRDLARIWERALRRAAVPVAWSEGFSPRPRIAFGLALSTGYESRAEYLDLDLIAPVEPRELTGRLTSVLPEGIDVIAAAPIEPGEKSLQEAVTSCTWRIEANGVDQFAITRALDAALAAPHLVLTRQRKGRPVTDDVRPAVLGATVVGLTAVGVELEAELAVHPRSVRPAELLLAIEPDGSIEEGRVQRTAQWTWLEGARGEPLIAVCAPEATKGISRLVRAS